MSEKKFDKNKLPSRHVSVGPERAPHRSYYYAMGMTEDDIKKVLKSCRDRLGKPVKTKVAKEEKPNKGFGK